MTVQTSALMVLGMHRSGTSATSGALEHLGFALGGRLVPAAEDNPKGYFEHEGVVAQHERFLEALGRSWADPRPLPREAWEGRIANDVRQAIDALIRDDFRGRTRWAVKDPRLSRLLPLWFPLWEGWGVRPHALVVLRRPVEVAGSLARRDGFPALLSDWLWLRHTFEALIASSGMPLTCLDYGALLDHPAQALGRALGDIGLDVGDVDDEVLGGFVERGMNHHGSSPVRRSAPASRLADELFEACIASPRGLPAARQAEFEARMAECWANDGPALEAGMAPYLPLVRERARLREAEYRLSSAYAAQVRWSEQAATELTALRGRIEQHEADAVEAGRVEAALRRDLSLSESVARSREAERDALLVERVEANARMDSLLAEREQLLEEQEQLRQERAAIAAQLRHVLASRSWRFTRPLRWLAGRIRRMS